MRLGRRLTPVKWVEFVLAILPATALAGMLVMLGSGVIGGLLFAALAHITARDLNGLALDLKVLAWLRGVAPGCGLGYSGPLVGGVLQRARPSRIAAAAMVRGCRPGRRLGRRRILAELEEFPAEEPLLCLSPGHGEPGRAQEPDRAHGTASGLTHYPLQRAGDPRGKHLSLGTDCSRPSSVPTRSAGRFATSIPPNLMPDATSGPSTARMTPDGPAPFPAVASPRESGVSGAARRRDRVRRRRRRAPSPAGSPSPAASRRSGRA